MPIEKLPPGTQGARTPPNAIVRALTPMAMWFHRRRGDTMMGMPLLYLTTRGARSGELRTTPVARFDDGRGGWFIVASWGGSVRHPGWYHNLAAHPDEVWAELEHRKRRVTVEQLPTEERDRVWEDVISKAGPFAGYEAKTDRVIPVLRLTPVEDGDPAGG